ncbi:hypothetical protein D3C72_1315230 [compost metagenome]
MPKIAPRPAATTNSSSTDLRFFQLVKLSRIGAFEVVLAAFIRAKTGDSCSLPRM